jgi:hypothetical protein
VIAYRDAVVHLAFVLINKIAELIFTVLVATTVFITPIAIVTIRTLLTVYQMTHQKLTFLGVINIVIRDILDIPGEYTHGAHQHHDNREVCEGTSHFIFDMCGNLCVMSQIVNMNPRSICQRYSESISNRIQNANFPTYVLI